MTWPPPNPHHTLPREAVATSEHPTFVATGPARPLKPIYLFPHVGCGFGTCLAGARLIDCGNRTWRPPT